MRLEEISSLKIGKSAEQQSLERSVMVGHLFSFSYYEVAGCSQKYRVRASFVHAIYYHGACSWLGPLGSSVMYVRIRMAQIKARSEFSASFPTIIAQSVMSSTSPYVPPTIQRPAHLSSVIYCLLPPAILICLLPILSLHTRQHTLMKNPMNLFNAPWFSAFSWQLMPGWSATKEL